MVYSNHFNTRRTPQSEPIPGSTQEKNNGGGYGWKITPWQQLERFLILGTEGNTMYVTERALTIDNSKAVVQCIKEDGRRAVEMIRKVSVEGKAPKNDPAIFALALACTFGSEETKKYAYSVIKDVCRIGTHIFSFTTHIQNLRGWSRGLRKGVAEFYTKDHTSENHGHRLALQLAKYRERNGWTHKDILRLSHPKPITDIQKSLLQYAAGKYTGKLYDLDGLLGAMDEVKSLNHNNREDLTKGIGLIREFRLTHEMVPTEFYGHKEVWEALLEDMPMTAMIRNLGKMTSVGLLKSNLDEASKLVVRKLSNVESLKKARIHPLNVLVANRMYAQGKGDKGSLVWSPVSSITAALEDTFYKTFDHVEPTGKNGFFGLDVSGSMMGRMSNLPLSYMEAALCMLMVQVRTEPFTETIAFDTKVRTVDITKNDNLESAMKKAIRGSFGATDCSQPMVWAQKNKIPVDAFYVYTDNETNSGSIHPSQALKEYRRSTGRNAKLAVIAMQATNKTIADPDDSGMLDVVGFSTDTPAALAQFVGA